MVIILVILTTPGNNPQYNENECLCVLKMLILEAYFYKQLFRDIRI